MSGAYHKYISSTKYHWNSFGLNVCRQAAKYQQFNIKLRNTEAQLCTFSGKSKCNIMTYVLSISLNCLDKQLNYFTDSSRCRT